MKEEINKSLRSASEVILTYYRFKDWLALRVKEHIHGTPHHKLHRTRQFWEGVLQKLYRRESEAPPIEDGDIITFRDGFLSDWLPLAPGLSDSSVIDLKDHKLDYVESLHMSPSIHHSDFHLFSMSRWRVNQYLGLSVKLPHFGHNDFFAICSLTDVDSYDTYSSIPVVLSKSAYSEYRQKKIKQNVVNVDLTGIVRVNNRPSLREMMMQLGVATPFPLSTELSIPDCWVQVSSPLDIQPRYHTSHPDVRMWSIVIGIASSWLLDSGMLKDDLEKVAYLSHINFEPNSADPREVDPQRIIEAYSDDCPNAKVLVSGDALVGTGDIDTKQVVVNNNCEGLRRVLRSLSV